MNCRQVAELLPWYLEGGLDAVERRELGEHLKDCETCGEELAEAEAARLLLGGHVPVASLLDYAGDAPGTPRNLIEAHLAGCRTCAEELAMAFESRRLMERPAQPSPLSGPAGAAEGAAEGAPGVVALRRSPPPPLWRAAAVAAAVVGLIGVGGGLWSWRTLDRQRQDFAARQRAAEQRIARLETEVRAGSGDRVNVPIHDLWPDGSVMRSAGSEPARLPAAPGPAATLILNSQLEPGREVDRLEIRDVGGELLRRLTGARVGPTGGITLSLALASLPRAELRILLFDAGSEEPIETYTLELG